MAMYSYVGYVGLCMAVYAYVGLCMAMYGYVGLCMAMYSYVGLFLLRFLNFISPLPKKVQSSH